jgi:hypothetical protein
MTEPLYHYAVKEILIEGNNQKLITCTEFSADGATLPDCKMHAEQFYINRRKILEYRIMLGIYEISKRQTFELILSLIETLNGDPKEYITRSIVNPISQETIEYEKKILTQYPNNVNNWRNIDGWQDTIGNKSEVTSNEDYEFNKRCIANNEKVKKYVSSSQPNPDFLHANDTHMAKKTSTDFQPTEINKKENSVYWKAGKWVVVILVILILYIITKIF